MWTVTSSIESVLNNASSTASATSWAALVGMSGLTVITTSTAGFEPTQRERTRFTLRTPLSGSTAATIAQIDAHMNLVDFFYARDVLIQHAITGYVIRTAPFYTPTSGGDLLDQFRNEWNTNQTGITRDLGHLMTAKPGSIIQYGGLAWVAAVMLATWE